VKHEADRHARSLSDDIGRVHLDVGHGGEDGNVRCAPPRRGLTACRKSAAVTWASGLGRDDAVEVIAVDRANFASPAPLGRRPPARGRNAEGRSETRRDPGQGVRSKKPGGGRHPDHSFAGRLTRVDHKRMCDASRSAGQGGVQRRRGQRRAGRRRARDRRPYDQHAGQLSYSTHVCWAGRPGSRPR